MSLIDDIEAARKRFIAKQDDANIGTLEGLKELMKKKVQSSTDTVKGN